MNAIDHLGGACDFLHKAIKTVAKKDFSASILDFGCGKGQLVQELRELGYHDTYGCDVLNNEPQAKDFLKNIQLNPYRLPFPDNHFDIVVSTSVLEHAQNSEDFFKEIYRVLKPNGYALHLFPGKWYLPYEPHIYVPLVNWFWPHCPDWWLKLWAVLGIRNEFQKDLSWQQVYLSNKSFCEKGLSYHKTGYYEKLSASIFGNYQWAMDFYIDHAEGKVSQIARKLPFKKFWGFVSRELRMGFLVNKKI